MFSGEFEYRIDDKGRIPLPPKFRKELAGGVVLFSGPDNNILLYPVAEWEKFAAGLGSNLLEPSKMRQLKRVIFGTAVPTELDRQGRISLTPRLRKHAGIKNDVMVVGMNNTLEIWDMKTWEKVLADDLAQSWQNIESLNK